MLQAVMVHSWLVASRQAFLSGGVLGLCQTLPLRGG